ncbi:MAG: N-ATPase, AtpR subunit [Pseudomonadota bacterium]|jgi:hypothetical protein
MTALGCLLLGFVLGLVYFAELRASLRQLGHPLRLWGAALLRLALAGLVFWLVATRAGGVATLAALAGFVAARWAMLRRAR